MKKIFQFHLKLLSNVERNWKFFLAFLDYMNFHVSKKIYYMSIIWQKSFHYDHIRMKNFFFYFSKPNISMVLVPWQLRAWFWQVLLLLHCNNIVVIFFCLALFFQVFELCVADNEKASTLRWRTQKTYRTITKKFCCFENFCSSLTRRQTDCQQNQQGMILEI